MPAATRPLTRSAIFAQAWPIMLGQAAIPLVGIVDTAVIGRTGDAAALAGVALGATIISMVFWAFGFLRMGMTGLTAQAEGAGQAGEVTALLLRGLLIGGGIGIVLFALSWPIQHLALAVLAGGDALDAEAGGYVSARFFGAPAALCVFAINGWLLGLARTRAALALQLAMNLANIALDLWFVWGFGWGARGVGLGTAGAEWIALAIGLMLCARTARCSPLAMLRRTGRATLLQRDALLRLFAVNRDLMIRTIALLLMFAWFANAGARIGTATLAANHVLLQFVSFAAFILDAFAFTAEARVGNAVGARSKADFLRAARLTGEFSLVSGAGLALLFLTAGPGLIALIAVDPEVRRGAELFLPFAAAIPLIGMPSWLLDGLFIGATQGRALRNAAVAATIAYIAIDWLFRPYANWGVWCAFTLSYCLRAAALGVQLPALLRSIDDPVACGDKLS